MSRRLTRVDRPTIIDVAEMANVSRQTVSRVVSDHPRVAPATRERVKEAIETLGYRPNRMARALVTQSSLTFGFAAVDMRDLHFGETCAGVRIAAQKYGYHLVVTEYDLTDDRGIGTLETLLTLGVDGIAMFPASLDDDDIAAFAARSGRPLVMIGRTSEIPGVVSIAVDEVSAAEMVVDHLVSRGKRRIGVLMNDVYPDVVHDRFHALQRAIASRTGGESPPVEADFPKIGTGRSAATRLLGAHPELEAIVAFNDTMAMGALLACRDLGLRVPRDVAIVGYDGIPYGEVSDPPLTTIIQDSIGMAEAAFSALILSLEEGSPIEGEVLLWPPELLVRAST